ncbi:Cadherin [Trinorchestia longiramus]|nr:Cadherin [Trinorchestia longiramus]
MSWAHSVTYHVATMREVSAAFCLLQNRHDVDIAAQLLNYVFQKFVTYVVPGSGRGWQLVTLTERADGGAAELRAKAPLDFEDPNQRGTLRFQVQVTDQGPKKWYDRYRLGVSYVSLRVKDMNDNTPVFAPGADLAVSLPEDAPVGTVVGHLPARDRDAGPESAISFDITLESNPESLFSIDANGTVLLIRKLDREHMASHHLKVLVRDSGTPARTATATLKVSVADVNDNQPYLLSPRTIPIPDPVRPDIRMDSKRVAFNLTFTDLDDWGLSNGPPFRVFWRRRNIRPGSESNRRPLEVKRISFSAPQIEESENVVHIPTLARLTSTDARLGLGSDIATATITVSDSGQPRQTSTVTITFVGDHRSTSKSSKKIIKVYKMRRSGTTVPLGGIENTESPSRLQREHSWLKAHPFFRLDQDSGELHLLPSARERKYELVVTSSVAGTQSLTDVEVDVKLLTPTVTARAVPLEIAASCKTLLTADMSGESHLSRMLSLVSRLVVSESGSGEGYAARSSAAEDYGSFDVISVADLPKKEDAPPTARVWIASEGAAQALELLFKQHASKSKDDGELHATILGCVHGRGVEVLPISASSRETVFLHKQRPDTEHGPQTTRLRWLWIFAPPLWCEK